MCLSCVFFIRFSAFVFSQFVSFANETWIGLSRDQNKQEFKFEDGSRLAYSFWAVKPRSTAGGKRECVRQTDKMTWTLESCDSQLPFVCKINREPVEEQLFVGNCSEGWNQYNGKCYKMFNNKFSWPEARKSCASYGGDLVTIDSYSTQKHMEFLVRGVTQRIWIGMYGYHEIWYKTK